MAFQVRHVSQFLVILVNQDVIRLNELVSSEVFRLVKERKPISSLLSNNRRSEGTEISRAYSK